jgi:3-oxoacyl-[acyl-carrier protein] reductase
MGLHSFRDETGVVTPERREEAIRVRALAAPLGLAGTPTDIALAVLYLASDASRFMTG